MYLTLAGIFCIILAFGAIAKLALLALLEIADSLQFEGFCWDDD